MKAASGIMALAFGSLTWARCAMFPWSVSQGTSPSFCQLPARASRTSSFQQGIQTAKLPYPHQPTSCRANSQYEGMYLLGTSIARPLIAKRQIEIAKAVGVIWKETSAGCIS